MFEVYALPAVAIVMSMSFGLMLMMFADDFKFAFVDARGRE